MRIALKSLAAALVVGVAATTLEAAPIPISEAAFGPGSTLVTFSEVALGTNGDGLTIGNSTFDWAGTGGITVVSGGPNNTNNIQQPALLSTSSTGVLTIVLSSPVNQLGYAYAILGGVAANATTIAIFDNLTPLGSLSYTGVLDPAFLGGFAAISNDVAFNRVELTFGGVAFDLDELRTAAVPEPTSMLLLGCGVAGLLAKRRLNRNRSLA